MRGNRIRLPNISPLLSTSKSALAVLFPISWLACMVLLSYPSLAQTLDSVQNKPTSKPISKPTEQVPPEAKNSTPTNKQRYITVGFRAMQYSGSLGNSSAQPFTPALALGLQFNGSKRFSTSFQAGLGFMQGYNPLFQPALPNAPTVRPNNQFRTDVVFAQGNLQFALIKSAQWQWYAEAGLGLLRFEPLDENNAPLQTQNATRATGETYGQTTIFLPISTGVRYFPFQELGFGFSLGWLNPSTQYLDNINQLGNPQGQDQVFSLQGQVFIPFSLSNK